MKNKLSIKFDIVVKKTGMLAHARRHKV